MDSENENQLNSPNEEQENFISNENDILENQNSEEPQEVSNLDEQKTEESDEKEVPPTLSPSKSEQNEEFEEKYSKLSDHDEQNFKDSVSDITENPSTEAEEESVESKPEIQNKLSENQNLEVEIEHESEDLIKKVESKSDISDTENQDEISENQNLEKNNNQESKNLIESKPDISDNNNNQDEISENQNFEENNNQESENLIESKSEISDNNNQDKISENQTLKDDVKQESESLIVESKSDINTQEEVLGSQTLEIVIKQETESLSPSAQSLSSYLTSDEQKEDTEISELIQMIKRLIDLQNEGLIEKDANIEDIVREIKYTGNLPVQFNANDKEDENNFHASEIKEEIPPLPYKIHEFKSSSYVLKFDINDSGTIFKISLPTLKEKEDEKYKNKNLIKNQPHIRKAIKIAIKRNKDYAYNYLKKIFTPGQTLRSTSNHVLRIERSRRMKLRLDANISAVKELAISPEKYIPNVSRRKRPTEYPAVPFRSPIRRTGESVEAARMRAARVQYIQRSDDTWLYHLRNKNIKPNLNKVTEVVAIEPQVSDPWSREISKTIKTPPIKIRSSLNPDSKIISRNFRARQLHLLQCQRSYLF